MNDVLKPEKVLEAVEEATREVVVIHTREQRMEFLRSWVSRSRIRRDGEEELPSWRSVYVRFRE